MRLYRIDNVETGAISLVSANSAAQAIKHVVDGMLRASVPSGIEVAALISDGITVERAGKEQAELPDDQEVANG